jgi:iron-sulfur cluster repair protein YtfE (RIC family)
MAERILVKDLVPKIEDHAQRIKVLEKTKEEFDDHIQKHDDVYVPMLRKHDRTLYGEHGDDGMVFDVKQIMRLYKKVDSLTAAVVVAIIVEIALRFLK